MKLAKKVLSIAFSALIWIVIIVAAFFIFLTLSTKQNGGVPSLFGLSPLSVRSDSMKGPEKDNFQKGDLIVVGEVDTDALKVGDIITFRDFDIIEGSVAFNSHRIESIEMDGNDRLFVTKGDNEDEVDPDKRSDSDVIGIYKFQIKGAGNVMDFLNSPTGFMVCLVIPLFLFFIWRLFKLIQVAIQYKKAGLEESGDADTAKQDANDSLNDSAPGGF